MGMRGPRMRQNYQGPNDVDYLIENEQTARSLTWSACGRGGDIGLNLTATVRSKNMEEEAMIYVEEVPEPIQIQWKRCF